MSLSDTNVVRIEEIDTMMLTLDNSCDTDFPFFPFKIEPVQETGKYFIKNHLTSQPVELNKDAAEVLRLADGTISLTKIITQITDKYSKGGDVDHISEKIVNLFRSLTKKDLIWWREVSLEPTLVQPPVSVFLEITAACNLRCRHCIVAAGAKLKGELTTERWLQLIHEMAEFGVENIAFSGGEPLIHPDFHRLVEKARSEGMTIQVATNGTLITPETALWLREVDAEVQVSLDGSRPEIHDYMRAGHEAFAHAIAGIKSLVEAGHKVTVGTVVTTINQEDISAIVELVEELGVSSFRLIPFVPAGRGEHYANMEVAPAEMKKITQYLHDLRSKTRLNIAVMEFEDMLNGKRCAEPVNLSRGLGCSGAVTYATITPTGELLPCHFFEGVRADSVASNSFAEVWNRSRFLNYFRQLTVADLHGKCRQCQWLGQCGGSCRATNFAKGDFLGSNYACWITQDIELDVNHE